MMIKIMSLSIRKREEGEEEKGDIIMQFSICYFEITK